AGTFAQSTPGTGVAVSTAMSLTGSSAGNYALIQPAGLQADIGKMALTVTVDPKSKVYGDPDPTLTYQVTSGALATGESLTGAITVTFVPNNLTIAPRPLTLTADAKTKVYGQADPVLTYQLTSGNLVGSDSLSGSLNRATGNDVGTYAIGQGGVTAGGNYAITFVPDNLTITAKGLTVTGAVAANKQYDRTTVASISGATLSGVEAGDAGQVTLAGGTVGTFAQRQVGTGIGVTTAMTLTGAKAGNYSLTQPAGLTANITAKALTVTGTTAGKTYDGTTTAPLTGATLQGVISGDTVTLGNVNAGAFATDNAGTGIAVTTSFMLLGADKDNYSISQPSL
ncbi:MAG: hypothetical protein EBS69_10535, partial [Verrucomicrobia bacterium]|nr:hypothetical protein [Verrucomicrobiota bacterium]